MPRTLELTEKQLEVIYLHEQEGLSFNKIAERLAKSRSTIRDGYASAVALRESLKVEALTPVVEPLEKPPEHQEDADTMYRAMLRMGYGKADRDRAYKSHLNGFVAKEVTKPPETQELVDEYGKVQMLALLNIDPLKLAASSAKDLIIVAKGAGEMRQLHMGLPTAIVSREERQNWDKLAPALLAEIERRGLTIPAVKTTYQVESSDRK